MVVDSSALVAIIRNEPDRDLLMDRLAEAPAPLIGAVTWMETRMVVLSRSGDQGLTALRNVMAAARFQVMPVTPELANMAFLAFRSFGKGRHSAELNFGDCFAYALAKDLNMPLLFKGRDFARTDVISAV
jgi:ribonuclease VapC